MCCALSHMVVYISLGISQKELPACAPCVAMWKGDRNPVRETVYPFELKYLDKI